MANASINYYLIPEDVDVEVIRGDRHDRYKIGNTFVSMDAGQPVLQIRDGRWQDPPEELWEAIDRVSIKSHVYDYELDRAPGLYKLGNAKAYVDRISRTRDHGVGIMVEVTALNKEDALALWDAIHRGDIRPHDEMNQEQIPPLIDDGTLAEVREQAALLARQLLKREMQRLVESAA